MNMFFCEECGQELTFLEEVPEGHWRYQCENCSGEYLFCRQQED